MATPRALGALVMDRIRVSGMACEMNRTAALQPLEKWQDCYEATD